MNPPGSLASAASSSNGSTAPGSSTSGSSDASRDFQATQPVSDVVDLDTGEGGSEPARVSSDGKKGRDVTRLAAMCINPGGLTLGQTVAQEATRTRMKVKQSARAGLES